MSSVEISRTRVGTPRVCTFWNTEGVHFLEHRGCALFGTPRVCTFWNTEGVHFSAFHYYCIGGKGSRKYVPNIFYRHLIQKYDVYIL